MTDTTEENPRRRGRRPRTGRALLVLFALSAAAIAWKIYRVNAQISAVAEFESVQAVVLYDYDFFNGETVSNGNSWGPTWMRRVFGEDFFRNVTAVELKQPPSSRLGFVGSLPSLEKLSISEMWPTDSDLVHLQRSTNLRAFLQKPGSMRETDEPRPTIAITDAGLSSLRGLSRLEELDLSFTGVTDAGMRTIGKLSNLRVLRLLGTKVTPLGLRQIEGLSELRELALGDDSTTDAGLAEAAKHKHLEVLWASSHDSRFRPTDQGLAQLSGLSEMRELNLHGSLVTDVGLVHLRGMKNLERLNLEGSSVSDAGMTHLGGFPQLKRLDVGDTKISLSAIMSYYREHPSLEISTKR